MGGRHRRRRQYPDLGTTVAAVTVSIIVFGSSWVSVWLINEEDAEVLDDTPLVREEDPPIPPMTVTRVPAATASVPVAFDSCEQAAAAGRSLIPNDDPQYSELLDRDGDGVACDRNGDPPTPTQEASAEPPAPVQEWPSTGFNGVKPFVAVIGHYVGTTFGIDILGVGSRGRTSDHPTGYALDLMVNDDRALGDRLAECMLDNQARYHVKYVIWRQRYNDGSGWQLMEDRGGATANHFDHVHVSFVNDTFPLPTIGAGC